MVIAEIAVLTVRVVIHAVAGNKPRAGIHAVLKVFMNLFVDDLSSMSLRAVYVENLCQS